MTEFAALVAKHTSDVVIVTTAEGHIEWVNDGFVRLTEYSLDEIVGRKPGSFLQGPATDAATVETMRTAIRERRSFRVEIVNYSKSGRMYWLAIDAQPVMDASGACRRFIAIERDITQEKSMAQAAFESDSRFRSAFDSTPFGMALFGDDGVILKANDAFRALIANPRNDLVGSRLADCIDGEDRKLLNRTLDQVRAGRVQDADIEVRSLATDDEPKWVALRFAAILDSQGAIASFIAHAQDMTARKRIEAERRRQNELVNAISAAQTKFIASRPMSEVFETLIERLFHLTDADFGFICELDRYALCPPLLHCLALGRRLNGSVLFDATPPSGVASADTLYRRMEMGDSIAGRAGVLELPIYHADLRLGVVGLARREGAFPENIADFLQPVLRTCGTILEARHIEERRRRAEAKYRERQIRLQTLVDTAAEAIIVFDESGLVDSINPAAERMLGQRARDVVGGSVGELFFGKSPLHEIATLCDSTRPPRDRELLMRRRDESELPVEASLGAMALHGRTYYTLLLRDISRRKLDELTLRQHAEVLQAQNDRIALQKQELTQQAAALAEAVDRADAANRAKSQFLATMSHEIRTPMTAILGFSDLATQELRATNASPAAESMLTTIRRSGEFLLDLINDILDLSRIEAGRMEIERLRVDVRGLFDEVVCLMKGRATAKGLTLDASIDAGVPTTILTDPTRLRQILVNLVGNSIKFTEVGGVRLVGSQGDSDHGHTSIVIDVIDTGIGIADDERSRIFEPFSQADSSMTRRYGGSGLGLTISQRLAQLLGGSITVESEKGRGSRFRLEIDAGPPDESPSTKPAEPAKPSPVLVVSLDAKILCVDDNADNQRLVGFYLRKAGARVVFANDGADVPAAMAAAREAGAPFDLILMDMQMPEIDGYTATRRLREAGDTTPVIALTAHAMAHDRQLCLDAGCDDFTTKPIDRDALLRKIAEYAPRFTVG